MRNTSETAFILARKNLGGAMESSARFCMEQAIQQKDADNLKSALNWCVKSLSYSVGIFHADYQRAAKIAEQF